VAEAAQRIVQLLKDAALRKWLGKPCASGSL
jgi:hypothetical protein